MPLKLRLHGAVPGDVDALGAQILKVRVARLVRRLLEEPLLGDPLQYQRSTGNLEDCRKLYFDQRPDVPPRYRIVYRVEPDEHKPKTIHTIAVGDRDGSLAYKMAVKRLGRE